MDTDRKLFQAGHCVLTLFFLLLACVVGRAADAGDGFDAANKLYEEGKFSEAAAAYGKLVQSGTVSSAVYFNLGNAFFKSGQLGEALAAYRDAEWISPRDPEVRGNLQFVRGQVQGPTLPTGDAQRWLAALTINEWATFAAVVLWLWLALLVSIQFRPAWKQSLRGWLWFGGIATLALCGCLVVAYENSSMKTAIVVKKDAVLHNGPLDEAPGGITVHDGAELTVIDNKNDWLQVRIDNNRIGWLKRDQVVLAAGV
jgi:tetratricopeptide (TPR) repeat protein